MLMMNSIRFLSFGLVGLLMVAVVSCDLVSSDEDDGIDPPDTYEFTRDGESTVAYPGQVDRLDMVSEMASYIGQGDAGEAITEQALVDMYVNEGNNGGGHFSFSSDRQLENKTFPPDRDDNFFRDLFARAAAASENGEASEGSSGLIEREQSGSTILVDEKGREFGQLLEKGMMGAIFYHQIFNVYLTDERIGPNVENEELVEGENYTAKEHHFDEAFGYFGAPVDFTSPWPESRADEPRFWAHYSDVVDNVNGDGDLGTNEAIMDAYIRGRTAIVNDNQEELDEQVQILYEQLELVTAATAVHYINSTLSHLGSGNRGEAFHALSEAWAFVNAIKYSPQRELTLDEINQIKNTHFGENGSFWNVNQSGLNTAKSLIVDTYPELESIKNQL